MKSVCFCFPFDFFPFPPAAFAFALGSSELGPPLSSPSPAAPAPHAAAVGALEVPRIFFNDTFPLTCGLLLAFDEVGSSGNKEPDSFGAGCLEAFDGRTLTEDMTGPGCDLSAEGWAELADHGVVRWPWRKDGARG